MKQRLLVGMIAVMVSVTVLADSYAIRPRTASQGGTVAATNNNDGTTMTLTASPAFGYAFTEWNDGAATITDNPKSDYAPSGWRVLLQATFTVDTRNVYGDRVLNPAAGGTVSVSAGTCPSEFVLTPHPAFGYSFYQWADDPSAPEVRSVYANDPTQWRKGAYKALFAADTREIYGARTISAAGGSILVTKGTCPNEFILTASPARGYEFTEWADEPSAPNPRSVFASDMTNWREGAFKATFTQNNRLLYASQIRNHDCGTVSIENGSCPSQYTISATPAAGYAFIKWTDGATDNPRTITIDDASQWRYSYSALFLVNNHGGRIDAWKADSIIVATETIDLSSTTADIYVDGSSSASDLALTKNDEGYWRLTAALNSDAGKDLRLTFTCGGNIIAVIDTVVPYVVSSNTAIAGVPSGADVQVVSGTLTVDANASVGALDVYPGAKAVVQAEKALAVNSLVMRADGRSGDYPQLVVNGTISNANSDTIYYDYTVDHTAYYPLAVPYDVKCEEIRTKSGATASYQAYAYDGATRAANVSGWTEFDDEAENAAFEVGKGYTIYGVPDEWNGGERQNKTVIRFPMKADLTSPEAQKTTTIYKYENGGTNASNKNWNFIANPYLADYKQADDSKLEVGQYSGDELSGYTSNNDGIRYVTYTTDNFRTYTQTRVGEATIKAFNPFFVQASLGEDASASLTFTLSNRAQNAPRRMKAAEAEEIALGVTLSSDERTDRTGLLYSEDFTAAYDLNADLAKMFGSGNVMTLYSLPDDNVARAFNAMPKTAMNQTVKLGFRHAPAGELTIAFDDAHYDASAFKEVILVDNEESTAVDLLKESYVFTTTKAQDDERFELFFTKASGSATDVEETSDGGKKQSIEVYDLMGRKVTSDPRKLSQGVYIIMENGQSRKTVIQ